MIIPELAKIVLLPYLWWFGYDFDAESIQECRDAINLQYIDEQEKYR